MSDKQEIYKIMLMRAIPHIRNVQSSSMFTKALDKSCYQEAELVHNLYVSILIPEFIEHDIWFLNYQARRYYEQPKSVRSNYYEAQCSSITELFNLIPENMKGGLLWAGPNS